jgi:integrase
MEAILVALAKLERMPDDERLFPVSMMTLKRSLSNLWKETGLPDVRLHDLRRTHATMMMQLGIDPKAIAGRLGHSGLSMLGRHYAVDRGDAEAVRRFEESRTVA